MTPRLNSKATVQKRGDEKNCSDLMLVLRSDATEWSHLSLDCGPVEVLLIVWLISRLGDLVAKDGTKEVTLVFVSAAVFRGTSLYNVRLEDTNRGRACRRGCVTYGIDRNPRQLVGHFISQALQDSTQVIPRLRIG